MSNILKVKFGKETQIVSNPLYQYDYGQKVRIFGLNLPAHYEVHFSNYERGDATTVLASLNEFDIPDMYLQSGRNVYVWIYLHAGNDDGETEYQITIPVLKRAKPTDEEPTPEEQSIIDQTIIALNNAVTEARTISADVTEKDEHVTQLYGYVNTAKAETYNYKEDAEAAAELLKNASAQAETLPATSEATAAYSHGVFSFGIPTGKDGEAGNGIDHIVLNDDYTLTIYYTNGNTWTSDSIRGAQGIPGIDGKDGTPGADGKDGKDGKDGAPGRDGQDGAPGQPGRDGADGQDGAPGVTYTPNVSVDGEISWTNDGGLPNPQPRNITGPQGQDGAPGQPGATGPAGKSAYASAQDGGYSGTEAQFEADLAGVGNKQNKIIASGLLKGDGAGGVSAATPGTDYQTPLTAGTDYLAPSALAPYRTAAAQDTIDNGKQPTLVSGENIKTINGSSILGSGNMQIQGGVTDVQVNGTSIVQDGVANVPMASASTPGVVISGTVSVTGTTPTITALSGVRYVCGEVTTLDITLPASGIVDVTFESGSVPTVLTITPPSGVTLKWANGFDPTALEADTTYEINICDGLGVAASWI